MGVAKILKLLESAKKIKKSVSFIFERARSRQGTTVMWEEKRRKRK
jgi:hypothetical protein